MASYTQQPAYNTYQTQTYQIPAQQIAQALASRQNFWDSAATNVQEAYQNYLGLDLSREDNHSRLSQLMQGVNENLKKATQTDLSIGENYGKAMGIFDPITHDDNIMGDHAITTAYKSQLAIAQDLRTKNGGKEYSDINVRDMMNGLKEYVQDKNPGNWREHFATRRFYSPYVDVAPELAKLYKDYKPSVMSSTLPDVFKYAVDKSGKRIEGASIDKDDRVTDSSGKLIEGANVNSVHNGYMRMTQDKSTSAAGYRIYLDSNLSEKAKNQLAIEGRVKYEDHIDALAQDYTKYNSDQIKGYTDYVKQLEGERYNAKGTDRDAYDTAINEYQGRINDLGVQNAKLIAGDYSYLKDNKDAIAGHIYTTNFIDQAASAAQRKDITVKYSDDRNYINTYNQSQQNDRLDKALESKALDRQVRMYGLQLKYGVNNGTGRLGLGDESYNTATKSNNETFGADRYNQAIEESKKELTDATNKLTQTISSDLGADPNGDKKVWDAAWSKWMSRPENKQDPVYQQYVAAVDKRGFDQAVELATNEYVNKKIALNNPEIAKDRNMLINNVNKGENLSLYETENGYKKPGATPLSLNLSQDDIKKILSGTHPSIKLEDVATPNVSTPMGPAPGTKNPTLIINGKQYRLPSSNTLDTYNNLGQNSNAYNAKRNELLNQAATRVEGIKRIFGDETKVPWIASTKNIVTDAISGTGSGVINKADIELTKVDHSGGIFFKVQDDPKVKQSGIEEKVVAAGGRFIKEDAEYYLPPKTFGSITQPKIYNDPRLGSLNRLVELESFNNPSGRFPTPDMKFGTRNFAFDVIIDNGRPTFLVKHMGSGAKWGTGDGQAPFETIEAAAAKAQQLGNLPKDQFERMVQVLKNVPGYKEN